MIDNWHTTDAESLLSRKNAAPVVGVVVAKLLFLLYTDTQEREFHRWATRAFFVFLRVFVFLHRRFWWLVFRSSRGDLGEEKDSGMSRRHRRGRLYERQKRWRRNEAWLI